VSVRDVQELGCCWTGVDDLILAATDDQCRDGDSVDGEKAERH
jgi:hypothetical protein